MSTETQERTDTEVVDADAKAAWASKADVDAVLKKVSLSRASKSARLIPR